MIPRNAFTSNDYMVWGQGNGKITNFYGEGGGTKNQGNDSFTFSGFGSNDKKKRKIPTPGSYTKIIHKPMRCTRDFYWKPFWNSSYWHHTVLMGSEQTKWTYGTGTGYLERHTPAICRYDTPEHDPRAYNDAVSRLYEKLKDSELNLAVSLGEYKETQKMIMGALRSVGRVTQMARKLRRELMHNPSLVISKAWLGMKYGWLPAYNDVYNLLHHTSTTWDGLQEIKVRRKIKREFQRGDRNVYIGKLGWYVDRICRSEHVSQCEISVDIDAGNQTAFDLSRITSLNPLTIAWELTPLSFVVDWFVDVGGYLAAQEAALLNGLVFRDGYVTKTAWIDSREHWWPSTGTGWSIGSRYHVIKSRVRLTDFPRPMLPTLKVDLGSQRIMSAAALLRTILLGGLKH